MSNTNLSKLLANLQNAMVGKTKIQEEKKDEEKQTQTNQKQETLFDFKPGEKDSDKTDFYNNMVSLNNNSENKNNTYTACITYYNNAPLQTNIPYVAPDGTVYESKPDKADDKKYTQDGRLFTGSQDGLYYRKGELFTGEIYGLTYKNGVVVTPDKSESSYNSSLNNDYSASETNNQTYVYKTEDGTIVTNYSNPGKEDFELRHDETSQHPVSPYQIVPPGDPKLNIAAGETKLVEFHGQKFELKNTSDKDSFMEFGYATTQDGVQRIIIVGNNIEITDKDADNDNLYLIGNNLLFHGVTGDDNILFSGDDMEISLVGSMNNRVTANESLEISYVAVDKETSFNAPPNADSKYIINTELGIFHLNVKTPMSQAAEITVRPAGDKIQVIGPKGVELEVITTSFSNNVNVELITDYGYMGDEDDMPIINPGEIGSKEWAAQFTQYDLKWYDIKYDEQGRVSKLKWNGTDGKVTGPNILFKYYDDGSYDVAQSGGLQLQDQSIITKYSADGTKIAEVTIPNPPKEPTIIDDEDDKPIISDEEKVAMATELMEVLGLISSDSEFPADKVVYDPETGRVTEFRENFTGIMTASTDTVTGYDYKITYNDDGTITVERTTVVFDKTKATTETTQYGDNGRPLVTYDNDGIAHLPIWGELSKIVTAEETMYIKGKTDEAELVVKPFDSDKPSSIQVYSFGETFDGPCLLILEDNTYLSLNAADKNNHNTIGDVFVYEAAEVENVVRTNDGGMTITFKDGTVTYLKSVDGRIEVTETQTKIEYNSNGVITGKTTITTKDGVEISKVQQSFTNGKLYYEYVTTPEKDTYTRYTSAGNVDIRIEDNCKDDNKAHFITNSRLLNGKSGMSVGIGGKEVVFTSGQSVVINKDGSYDVTERGRVTYSYNIRGVLTDAVALAALPAGETGSIKDYFSELLGMDFKFIENAHCENVNGYKVVSFDADTQTYHGQSMPYRISISYNKTNEGYTGKYDGSFTVRVKDLQNNSEVIKEMTFDEKGHALNT